MFLEAGLWTLSAAWITHGAFAEFLVSIVDGSMITGGLAALSYGVPNQKSPFSKGPATQNIQARLKSLILEKFTFPVYKILFCLIYSNRNNNWGITIK